MGRASGYCPVTGTERADGDMTASRIRIIEILATKNQIVGGKLAMIAGPHPPAL